MDLSPSLLVRAQPVRHRKDNDEDIERAEDMLVVLGEPLRKINVEVRSTLFCVARRECGQRADPAIESQNQHFRQYDDGKKSRDAVRAAPGEKGNRNDAAGEEGPGIDELLKSKREAILQIAARHGAHHVRVFGSVALGTATSDSDIDVLVEFEPNRSLLDTIALMRELEDLLGRSVDVVTEQALHSYIRADVLRQARAL